MKWTLGFLLAVLPLTAPCFAKQPSTTAVEEQVDQHCYFLPPEGWDIAAPETLSPKVKIAFFKKNNKGFCPTINLAVEETPVSSTEYLKAVKAIHEQDRANHWRALGKVRTAAGLAQLTEIDTTSEMGPIRLLQLILLKNGHAYILTAAALKEDFPDYYKVFQSAFRSLSLTSDLMSAISQLERKENLKAKTEDLLLTAHQEHFKEKQWLPFQEMVISSFADMGAFWQVLFLRDVQEKILSLAPPIEEIAASAAEKVNAASQDVAVAEEMADATQEVTDSAANATSQDVAVAEEIASATQEVTDSAVEEVNATSQDVAVAPQEIAVSPAEHCESVEENPQVAIE
ncbi:MAG: hypothetical protein HYX67_15385 [Candidatus Melainabacteria bacterium]|nr:hypothetical protein [Candidatus Melainabacteria bacterium]